MKMITSWRKLLKQALKKNGENFNSLASCTLTDAELYRKFDHGYGLVNGTPFTAWSANYVYFPARYDGSEWVASVPRNPNGSPTRHIGR